MQKNFFKKKRKSRVQEISLMLICPWEHQGLYQYPETSKDPSDANYKRVLC